MIGASFSSRVARGAPVLKTMASAGAWLFALVLQPTTAQADDADFKVRWHLQAGVNAVTEQQVFWRLADTTAPGSGYDPDKAWLEYYVKPGLGLERGIGGGHALHGKVSVVASYTQGTDAFDEGNTGDTTLEEAYLGLRGTARAGLAYDVSVGPRELRLGTGMLVASGASSGFERGALKFGPRKAWEQALVARLESNGYSGTAFQVSPNELPSSDGRNKLAGLDLRFDDAGGGHVGGTWLRVLTSDSPYVQAAAAGQGAPTILTGARRGTQALSLYAKSSPIKGLPNWTFTADLAHEWNRRIRLNAWAGRLQVHRAFENLPGAPVLSYGYQTFSGDDPDTAGLERFDPMYYEGNPNAWSTGSKSSMAFINSNVNAHSVALRLQPSQVDTFTLRYAHIRANRLRSPIQFGQATRVETVGGAANVVAGVTDPHLADDVFLEYNRVLGPQVFLSAGVAVSFPGRGIRQVTASSSNWTGAYVNLVFNH